MPSKLKLLFSRSERRRERAIEKGIRAWERRDFSDNSPQFVKERLLKRHGVAGAPWVETGTYLGTTTEFLAREFPFVHSIEPEPTLYKNAAEKFSGRNVRIHNGTSEQIMPSLLPTLRGDLNFWLDGHYSAGVTYKGEKDCPVIEELQAIAENLANLSKVTILIDDVRCFLAENRAEYPYPDISVLIQWADQHKFFWRIEHDIFIMKRHATA